MEIAKKKSGIGPPYNEKEKIPLVEFCTLVKEAIASNATQTQSYINDKHTKEYDALLPSPLQVILGNTQMMQMAHAIQHPFEKNLDSALTSIEECIFRPTTLLLVEYNEYLCPVGMPLSYNKVIKLTKIGEGTNAHFWTLIQPANARALGLEMDTLLGLKEMKQALEVYDVGGELNLTGDESAQFLLKAVPCWDPKTETYVCRIEVETEVLISSLCSKLFTDGYTPCTVVQLNSFTCQIDKAHDSAPLYMIQELLGSPQSGYWINSLEYLPEFLQSICNLYGYNVVEKSEFLDLMMQQVYDHQQFPSKAYDLDPDHYALGLTAPGDLLIRDISTDILISVLHTLLCLQNAFGIETNDTKPSNILFKVFTEFDYFHNQKMTCQEKSYLQYTWVDSSGQKKSFYLPNHGWVPKIADMGMAVAYRVPMVAKEKPSAKNPTPVVQYTSIGFYAYMAERFDDVQKKAQLGKKVAAEKPSYDQLLLFAQSLGYPDAGNDDRYITTEPSAQEMTKQALRTGNIAAIKEYIVYLKNRQEFGIHEEFTPGYDVHMFVSTFVKKLQFWLSASMSDSKLNGLPIVYLQEKLEYTTKFDRYRPAYEQVSPYGPLEALTFLQEIASGAFLKTGISSIGVTMDINDTRQVQKVQSIQKKLEPLVSRPDVKTEEMVQVIAPQVDAPVL